MKRIDQIGLEERSDRGDSSPNANVLAICGRLRRLQCAFRGFIDEIEGGFAKRQRLACVMCEHEDGRVERRFIAPPSGPRIIGPRTTRRRELVAPHDLGTDSEWKRAGDQVVQPHRATRWIGVRPRRGVHYPLMQIGRLEVTERPFPCLSLSGSEAVARNGELVYSCQLSHWGASRSIFTVRVSLHSSRTWRARFDNQPC